VGSRVSVSPPQGKGFPLDAARGKRLLLFATGSGISPIRAVVHAVLAQRADFPDVTLYFGVRTPQSFPFEEELASWERAGIPVIRTVSQPGESGWTGLTGYVQAHIREEPLENAVAFLCGQKPMVQAVSDELVRRGVPRERVFLNF
jgi:NAD(P)H-flavin reductase